MTGALGLKPGFLSGEILLNLDTEEDDDWTLVYAGGIDVTASKNYSEIPCPTNHIGVEITVNGLKGGHSGMDIHKGLGNSNKIMNRILFAICPSVGIMLSKVDGGSLRNAIPRESKAILSLQPELMASFEAEFTRIKTDILAEFKIWSHRSIFSLRLVRHLKRLWIQLKKRKVLKVSMVPLMEYTG